MRFPSRIVLAFVVTGLLSVPVHAQQHRPIPSEQTAPADAPSTITMVDKNEPGNRLVVTGKVVGRDGKPVAGASVYLWHTDASGHYDPAEPPGHQGNARLQQGLRTDARGRYTYTTVRPAPYPSRTIPSHVHYAVSAAGYKDFWLEMWFADDPLLTDDHRAEAKKDDDQSVSRICNVKKDAKGTWHCTQDVVLTRK